MSRLSDILACLAMTEPINTPAINWPGFLLCGMPLIHYMFTLFFYACVSISLGEWADTMGGDDPKAFCAGIPAFLSTILMILSFSVAPLVVFVGHRKKKLVQYLFMYSIALLLCIALFRFATPWLGTWMLD